MERRTPDEVPEAPDEPEAREGDMWTLGQHRLVCGDSTSEPMMRMLMGADQADLWLTDPPYNVDYGTTDIEEAKRLRKRVDGLKIENDQMSDGDFRDFLRRAYTAADGVMKPGAVFYIFHADKESINFRGVGVGWRSARD